MWHAGSATPVCFIWSSRGYAPVWATKKHRDTAHKQKTVSGGSLLPPAQHRTPASTSLGLCPAEAQPPPRMETLPPQWWPVRKSLQGRCIPRAWQLSLQAPVQGVPSGHLQKHSFRGKRKAWIQSSNSGACSPLISIDRSHQETPALPSGALHPILAEHQQVLVQ